MVANHLLQLLALTAMEPPVAFDADSVREQKVQVFRSIRPMSVEDVARFTVRGQYGSGVIDGKPVPGYRQEPGVNPGSITETYAAVKFHIENWRWAGVPFYIRTGKHLARNLTEIRVHLKPTPQALFAGISSAIAPNVITISIQPDEGISIAFDAKRPGTQMRTVTVQANFSYQGSFRTKGPVAYETLLLDSMRGDATLFTRRDEVEAECRIITPIEESRVQSPATARGRSRSGPTGPRRQISRGCSKKCILGSEDWTFWSTTRGYSASAPSRRSPKRAFTSTTTSTFSGRFSPCRRRSSGSAPTAVASSTSAPLWARIPWREPCCTRPRKAPSKH